MAETKHGGLRSFVVKQESAAAVERELLFRSHCSGLVRGFIPDLLCGVTDVRGKRGVTADTALRLAQLFKTTPQLWMHMQANFDLKVAMTRRRTMRLTKRP